MRGKFILAFSLLSSVLFLFSSCGMPTYHDFDHFSNAIQVSTSSVPGIETDYLAVYRVIINDVDPYLSQINESSPAVLLMYSLAPSAASGLTSDFNSIYRGGSSRYYNGTPVSFESDGSLENVSSTYESKEIKLYRFSDSGGYNTLSSSPGYTWNNGSGLELDTYYYFAVLNDGSAVIRDPGTPTDDVKEGLSVWQMLVDNGEVLPISDSSLHPRTAIGVRYDGTVVLVCVDGRQSPISCGATLTELAYIMKSLGCVRAANLDGGSSTTMLAKNSCGYEVELVNSPCYVAERQVASAIVITAPEKEHIDSDGDGYCDICGDLENEFISRILRIFLFFFDLIGRIFEVDLTTRIEHKLHK